MNAAKRSAALVATATIAALISACDSSPDGGKTSCGTRKQFAMAQKEPIEYDPTHIEQ